MQNQLPGQRIKFRIKSKIYLFDSTIISLSLKIFDWAKFRQRKGALKLHTLLDYQGAMPEYIHMTEGKVGDVTYARTLLLPKNSVVVADRGYYDFDLLRQWNLQDVRFVVRIRDKMVYHVAKEIPIKDEAILKDQIIIPAGKKSAQYEKKLRRLEIWDAVNEKKIILLTNELKNWTAKTISKLYKARWEIEFFFKDVKQHLKIKSFVGTTPNAVLIQIWTAMITLLLLKYLKMKAKFGWHLSNLVSFIRFTLFAHVHLYDWLNEPIFVQIRSGPEENQLTLF
jgi:IS4 transposase